MIRLLWFLCKVIFLVLFYLSVVQCDYNPYDTLYEGPAGRIYAYDNVTLSLVCTENATMLDAIKPLNHTRFTKYMSVGFCTPPETSYVEMLRALNIDASTIEGLTLFFKYNVPLPPRNYMQGLKIRLLTMVNYDETSRDILREVPDLLEPLSNVTEMNLEAILLPPLPETMRLKRLSLRKNAALKSWGNCQYLEELSVSQLSTLEFPVWPENCTRLANLQIDYMSPNAVKRIESSMIASAGTVRTLNVTYSRLRELPNDFLRLAKNLVHLDLSDNNFYDESFSQFPLLESLKWLALSSNPASGYFLEKVLPNVPALEELRMNNNDNIRIFCIGEEDKLERSLRISIGKLQQLPLKRISLIATGIHLRCLANTRFPHLEYINLRATISPEMTLLDLPKSDAPNLHVDFGYESNANFVNIYFTEADYEELRQKNSRLAETNTTNRLTVSLRYIKCDCQNGWLVRALRDFPNVLSMPNLHCGYEYGIYVLDEPVDNIECTTWYDRYTLNEHKRLFGCFYRIRWRDNASYATCKADQYPMFNESVYGLNSSNSKLTQLYNELPDTLQWIDLRRNRISRANSTAATALFAAGRQVWLGGNLIVCDCDNRPLLDAIAEHHAQIKDYEDLTCVDNDIPLSAISTAELCQTALKLSVGSLGFMAGVALIAGFFLRKYGDEIKMFLYTRGYCLSWVAKQDLDDRPYDAFISYAHGDEEYVKQHLLPGLESTVEGYRVCVHDRDWVVGDWIPAQIMRSVSLARRTIILLSTNFVKSIWSSLEFRYATANAAKDQRCRVLILVLDNVLDEPLDPELVSYLYYNTYLRCDDPWFWEKLRYAMPHKNKGIKSKDAKNTQDFEMKAREEGVNMETLHSGDAMITRQNQVVVEA